MKKALTLPEMIILLGVIGIIAIMLLTNLMKNHQKRVFALRLNQAYSTLNNAIKMAVADDNILTNMTKEEFKNASLSENDQNEIFAKYFLPYMSGITKLKTDWHTYTPNGTSAGYARMIKPYCANNGVCYKLIQSAGYRENNDSTFLNYSYIIVDVNGQSRPNTVGKDTFYFSLEFNENGPTISGQTLGVTKQTSIDSLYSGTTQNAGCNKTYNGWTGGMACSEIIIRNNWRIPNDSRYPW